MPQSLESSPTSSLMVNLESSSKKENKENMKKTDSHLSTKTRLVVEEAFDDF